MTSRRRPALLIVLTAFLCAVTLLVPAGSATAQSRTVRDGEGEAETTYGVDSARFVVAKKRASITARYSRLMSRGGIDVINADFIPSGSAAGDVEHLRARWTPELGWSLFSRSDGRTISCGWKHAIDYRRKSVRVVLPAACFGSHRDFKRMTLVLESGGVNEYGENGSDSLGVQDLRRR